MDEAALIKFLECKILEKQHLDYKVALSGHSKEIQHSEFLKDVTAFANANGGDIIIGAKEPSDDLSVSEQLIGIEDGLGEARNLENITRSCIDPRISGLQVVPVPLANDRIAIIVHVPPSGSRPHMVNYQKLKLRTFYIRHSESSVPMTTHEIREAVIAAASSEARAKAYMSEMEQEVRDYKKEGKPTLLIQATPLIAPETRWDVFNGEFVGALECKERLDKHPSPYCLSPMIALRPTMRGVAAYSDREDPHWIVEVHRTGYIEVVYRNKFTSRDDSTDQYVVHHNFCALFEAFAGLYRDLLDAAKSDLPYVLRCKYIGARNLHLEGDNEYWVYPRQEIVWEDKIRQVGDDITSISEEWCKELHYAFGLKDRLR